MCCRVLLYTYGKTRCTLFSSLFYFINLAIILVVFFHSQMYRFNPYFLITQNYFGQLLNKGLEWSSTVTCWPNTYETLRLILTGGWKEERKREGGRKKGKRRNKEILFNQSSNDYMLLKDTAQGTVLASFPVFYYYKYYYNYLLTLVM